MPWKSDNKEYFNSNNFIFSITHNTKMPHNGTVNRSHYCNSDYFVFFGESNLK